MKNYYNKKDVFKLIGEYSEKIIEIIIWEKSNPLPASGKSITNAYEFFIVFGDKALKSNSTYTKNIISTSVNSNMTKSHKAIMKQEVSDWFIENFTEENDVVLDPFMGAGTTGVSCKKYNRYYIGFEKYSQYVELGNNRIKCEGFKIGQKVSHEDYTSEDFIITNIDRETGIIDTKGGKNGTWTNHVDLIIIK